MVWRKVKLDPAKPAVKAKSARRGRPRGSKNKPKALEKQIMHWDSEPRTPAVDFKALAEKLQHALAKSYADYQGLEKDVQYFAKRCDVLEAHVEIKEQRIKFLELDLAHRKANEEGIFRDEDAPV